MQELWNGDLNEHGKRILRRYEHELPTAALSSAMGAAVGFFGSGALLTLVGAAVEGRYLDWRYPAVIVAATLTGYLVGRYFERRESAHQQAIIKALHGSGLRADQPHSLSTT